MDIHEVRRKNVERLIDKMFGGSRAAFARDAGINPTYVTRMLKAAGEKDQKRIGEDLARQIEGKLNLPSNSLDEGLPDRSTVNRPVGVAAHGAPQAAPSLAQAIGIIARALDSLTDADRERAAEALVTLTRAPDSLRARSAVQGLFAGLELPAAESAPSFSEYALDLARQIDAIPNGAGRHRAFVAAAAALHAQAFPDGSTGNPAPTPAPRPGAPSRKAR